MIKNQVYGILIATLFTTSCGFNKTMQKYALQPIDAKQQYKVNDQPFKSIGERNKVDSILSEVRLHRLFNVQALNNSSIAIAFTTNNELQISYQDSVEKKSILLKGRFTRAGYFKTKIKTKNIFIPLIYSNRQLEKFKLCIAQNGDLVIEFTDIREGNIFIFGGGGTYTKLYFFKRVE
jgi:hypothetical protein